MNEFKKRTTVYLLVHNLEWAQANIRNLSSFIDDRILELRREREGVSRFVGCECGANVSEAALKHSNNICPKCGKNLQGVFA